MKDWFHLTQTKEGNPKKVRVQRFILVKSEFIRKESVDDVMKLWIHKFSSCSFLYIFVKKMGKPCCPQGAGTNCGKGMEEKNPNLKTQNTEPV